MSKKLVNADREGDDPACIATPVSTTELVRVCSCSVDEKRGEGKPGLGTEEDVGLTGEVDAGGLGKVDGVVVGKLSSEDCDIDQAEKTCTSSSKEGDTSPVSVSAVVTEDIKLEDNDAEETSSEVTPDLKVDTCCVCKSSQGVADANLCPTVPKNVKNYTWRNIRSTVERLLT